MKSFYNLFILFSLVVLSPILSAQNQLIDEVYRPQFHYTPAESLLSKPNGIVFLNGKYHLFYPQELKGLQNRQVLCNHAVGTDLVHWQHQPAILLPAPDDEKDELVAVGSVLVDDQNLLNLQNGGETSSLLLFCLNGRSELIILYSVDEGQNWTQYPGKIDLSVAEDDLIDDPKVFWDADSKKYILIVYRVPGRDLSSQGVSYYSSENLIDWNFESHFAGPGTCVDMVKLKVNRRDDDTRWVAFEGDGSYTIGSFDGKKFEPETAKAQGDFGKNYQGPITFQNGSDGDDRIFQLAFMEGGEYPEMPFEGQLSFPCELGLKKYLDGVYLMRKPVNELELLHEKGDTWEEKNLIPGLGKNLTKKVKGDCLHIQGTFDLKSASSFGFVVRNSKKAVGVEIRYDVTKGILSCQGKGAKLAPEDGKIELEVLLDRTSIELFGNGGKAVLSSCYTAEPDARDLVLYNTGGELFVEKLEVYPIKSMYESK
jgi:sucrose-6-phosphate hydrolase SacC (GH32 family)